MKIRAHIYLLALSFGLSCNASAQMFGDDFAPKINNSFQTEQLQTEKAVSKTQPANDGFRNLKAYSRPATSSTTNTAISRTQQRTLPQNTTAAQKSSSVSTTATTKAKKPKTPLTVRKFHITEDGKINFEEEENIYLYYTNFKITQLLSGQPRCDISFVLFTSLSTTLSDISLRVQWPKINTGLQFQNVKPGEKNFYDYAFYGDGCYSMDKLPNIVINRCRIKGRTQKECASLFRLLRKGQ